MELDEVMRTTFACRDWTDETVSDADIESIIEVARFAPSGGNREPNRVVAIRSADTKRALRLAAEPAMLVYFGQVTLGEAPWNTVVLVVGADLSVVAAFDSRLDRVGVVGGASIYPFAWNILLAARSRGLGGVLTTMCAGLESASQDAVGFPSHVAVAAVIPLGHPVKQLTKLRRSPVADLLRYERWND
jgi:nitroreductase